MQHTRAVCTTLHPPQHPLQPFKLPFYGEIRLQRVRVCLQSKRLEVPVQRSSGNPEGRSQAAMCGAVVQKDFTEARTQLFDGNALPAGFALATAFQLRVGNPCLTLLLVLLPQSLNRLPFAAGLNRGGLVRTSERRCCFRRGGTESPLSKLLRFLRVGPWEASPAAGMPHHEMGRLLTGGSKLGW